MGGEDSTVGACCGRVQQAEKTAHVGSLASLLVLGSVLNVVIPVLKLPLHHSPSGQAQKYLRGALSCHCQFLLGPDLLKQV